MAHTQRIQKPEDRQYGDIWGKYDWKCLQCGRTYLKRYEAQQCCRGA